MTETRHNTKCPRCGYVTADVFACPTCKAREAGEDDPVFTEPRTGTDAEPAIALLRWLEWVQYGRCPSCGNLKPGGEHRYHGHFGHDAECHLAGLIDAPRGSVVACDCYRRGYECPGTPTYEGKPATVKTGG